MLYLIASIVYFVNIPFGFWRKSTRKFSFAWFASIHIPVFISIGLRYISGIETRFINILIFVTVFFAGQISGKYCYVFYHSRKPPEVNE
ncbi:MAG: hypothetical protein JEZ09_12415 [Salinivirgaceae bacterium]|nr:hypothetical protein [Salinivirgaceae bacterium]